MQLPGSKRPSKTPIQPKPLTFASEPKQVQNGRVKVLIVDNDPIVLDYVAMILEAEFDVVGRASDGKEALETVKRLSPSIVVTDISMPGLNGIEMTRRITTAYSNVKVVMLSVHNDEALVEASFAAGALGYVEKLHAGAELVKAVRSVLDGNRYRSRL